MPARARLQITNGPDRGKAFELTDELVHVGRGSGNQIVLTDPLLPDHSLSIVSRNGRYAVYTSVAEGIEVDGNSIPPERWVWLPAEANIKLNQRTLAQFVSPEADASVDRSEAEMPSADARKPAEQGPQGEKPAEKSKKSRKNVAKFITDGPGDPLVRLGADGHLPELRLAAGQVREREPGAKPSSPWLLYGAIAASFLFSILMLVVDLESRPEQTDKSQARREIMKYYKPNESGQPLEPYQIALQQAQRAHSRGDTSLEKAKYRYVLNLLRAEGHKESLSGLTGNRDFLRDDELEQLVSTLLSD